MMLYGLAGFVIVVAASFARRAEDRYQDFCIGAAIPIFLFLLLPISFATAWLRPATIDGSLRGLDLALRLDGFATTRWLVRMRWYFWIPPLYSSLPLFLAVAWALERSRTLLRASVIGALLVVPFYLLFPAVGPDHSFAGWPASSAHLANVSATAPRNCMPSMHFSWALLLAINARNRAWRTGLLVYSGLMAIATVAGGEHYFIDLLAAVPFTLAVQWIAEHRGRRDRSPAHDQGVECC